MCFCLQNMGWGAVGCECLKLGQVAMAISK